MPDRPRSRLGAVRDTVGAVVGAILGLAPHVLHHVGLIAGTAFVAGAGGNALLYAVGLLLSVPMLLRIHRRFGTWLAPVIATAVFTAMFLLSALVIGPAITSDDGPTERPARTPTPTEQHTEHHT
ncbi:hypothetical protein [Janibacter sp. G1551]|uniref:hypothetical protein n=1 Tax=Janibacter sp. G1551 TaxID=3420440 RepID=UPI003D02B5B9